MYGVEEAKNGVNTMLNSIGIKKMAEEKVFGYSIKV